MAELHLGHSPSAGALDPQNPGPFQGSQLPIFGPAADAQELVEFIVWHRYRVAITDAAPPIEIESQS